MRKLNMEELNRKSVDEFKESEKLPVVVVLDNIRSMHNVGSVFRTADAFLLKAIYLCGYTPQPPHRDIHKTALGATETVEWKYFPKATEAVDELTSRKDTTSLRLSRLKKASPFINLKPPSTRNWQLYLVMK